MATSPLWVKHVSGDIAFRLARVQKPSVSAGGEAAVDATRSSLEPYYLEGSNLNIALAKILYRKSGYAKNGVRSAPSSPGARSAKCIRDKPRRPAYGRIGFVSPIRPRHAC